MRDTSLDRLYRLLPGHIRASDANEGRQLQALMEILASELEVVEGDIDALYDNWFIETCEDWVVPYIGDLVGARMLRPFGDGSLRAYVANTLSYRQAKGTLAVIEQLARDVTGWPAVGVEFFRRLIQAQNVNHVRLGNLATVSLRDADAASLIGSPFETAAQSVDVRDIAKGQGRYNIPNLGLFVWRIQSFSLPFAYDGTSGYLGGIIPREAAIGPGFRLLDPAGRSLRLFNRQRTESAIGQLSTEANMPVPLRRRALAADLDGLRAGAARAGRYFLTRPVIEVRLDGTEIPLAKLHCCNLEDRIEGGNTAWNRPVAAGHVHFDPELGRLSLHASDEQKLVEVAYAFGAPHDIGGGPTDRREAVASWMEPFLTEDAPTPLWQIGVTRRAEEVTNDPDQGGPVVGSLAEAIELWNARAVAGARGIIALLDSASYTDDLTDADHLIDIPGGAHLAIVAAGWPAEDIGGGARRRTAGILSPQDRRPHIASDLHVKGTAQASETGGTLILDGLLLEGAVLIEDGDLGRLELRHGTYGLGAAELATGMAVLASNTRLDIRLDHAIIGAIEAGDAAGVLSICDSIIGEDRIADGDPAAMPVMIDAPDADLVLGRVTVFGRVAGRTIEADDSIFTGSLTIARRQQGCLRFSYVPEGSRTPRRYRCAPDLQIAQTKERLQAAFSPADEQAIRERVQPAFTSTFAEHYAFAQLARRCPPEITEGGEGGREMGAMNGLTNPMRLANLRDALDEYLPFGLTAGIIFET